MRDKKSTLGAKYAWPMGAWFSLFFIIPLLIIVVYSFLKRDVYIGVVKEFCLKAYAQMFKPKYMIILLRTLYVAAVSTAITIIISLPCGYAMARSRHQTLFLILIIIPFLTNSLIRIFAWKTILGENSVFTIGLNNFCRFFFYIFHSKEAVFKPVQLMYTKQAVILVSVYMYLPYAILPIFTAVDRFDFSLIEAARDLGATKLQSMFKVLLPGIRSGIVSALIFTFIPIFGSYTVPQMVGGKDSYMIGNFIVDRVQKVRNWPLAAAFSVLITVISMIAILWMLYTNRQEASLKKNSAKEESNGGTK